MKKNSLFFSIGLIICALVVMVSFAGCKKSSENSDAASSNASTNQNSDVEAEDNTLTDANQENSNLVSDKTDANGSKISDNKTNRKTSNTNTEEGQDVVIDFGEDDDEGNDVDIDFSNSSSAASTTSNSTTTTNSSKPSNNDGWTGDYIINK